MPQLQHEICTVPGCGRPHKARGYCQPHYQHWKRGMPIRAEIATRDRSVHEHCSEGGCQEPVKAKGLCKMHYARLLRHGHTRYQDRKRPPKPCSVEGCENHLYAKGLCHQHYLRHSYLLEKYGLTPEQEAEMLTSQNGVCAICRKAQGRRDSRSGKIIEFCVDHNHETQKIRGLLCDNCNRGIGLLGDSIEILQAAIMYLKFHSA